jgi:hypothetical protein
VVVANSRVVLRCLANEFPRGTVREVFRWSGSKYAKEFSGLTKETPAFNAK